MLLGEVIAIWFAYGVFIEKGANDWNHGLLHASLGGHRHLVDLFISKGACMWKWAFDAALEQGHKELAVLFHVLMKKDGLIKPNT